MRKLLYVIACLLAATVVCRAEGFKIGAHGGYTLGGDIEEESFGYGAQMGFQVNDVFSIELSGTRFEEEWTDIDIKYTDTTTQIALTARFGGEIAENVSLYGGGGINYNMIDSDAEYIYEADLQALAATLGLAYDSAIEIEIDNAIGGHLCAGIALMLTDNLELFAEYRYTFLEIEGDIAMGEAVSDGVYVISDAWADSFKEDYNFGLARIGLNLVM